MRNVEENEESLSLEADKSMPKRMSNPRVFDLQRMRRTLVHLMYTVHSGITFHGIKRFRLLIGRIVLNVVLSTQELATERNTLFKLS